MNKTDYKGIWVFAEQEDNVLSSTPLELLAKAIDLKTKLGETEPITAVLIGKDVSALSDTLFAHGAERVILVDNERLAEYKNRVYADALVKLVEKYKPSIFLFAASPIGRELAPRVMCRLGTGLTANAIDLDVDEDGMFVQTTPNFGGNILSHIAIPEARPQMCTVHPKVFEPIAPKQGATGPVIKEDLDIIEDNDFEVLGVEEKILSGKPIGKAEIVVAGGFGIKEQDDLQMLNTLADLIGGQVGCSRPLRENGWFGYECQIGQSGATITPKLIINIAISGAVQYLAGMDKSQCIMTINKNPNAEIFSASHYGAVADYKELVPAIIEEIKSRQS